MKLATKHTWKCGKCEDVVTSFSHIRHEMDYCKCGESAIDLEPHYTRGHGCPNVVSIEAVVVEEGKVLSNTEVAKRLVALHNKE